MGMSLYSVKAQILKGVVSDVSNGETIPMANVVVKSGQTIVQGGATDFDGQYFIDDLKPGVYNIEVSYIGYVTSIKEDIIIDSLGRYELNFKLLQQEVVGCMIYVTPCIIPFDFLHSSGKVFSIQDINNSPIAR